jgi:hypothetical protein
MLGLGLKIGRIFNTVVNEILLLMNKEVYVFQDNIEVNYGKKSN